MRGSCDAKPFSRNGYRHVVGVMGISGISEAFTGTTENRD